jgi:heme-degrading monooxygenase HmoA
MEVSHLAIIFRTRLRPQALADASMVARLEGLGGRMYELAQVMPGFLSYKDFAAADGESVTVIEFDGEENLREWRNHPEHLEAQRIGREEFFSWYQIQVCRVERQYGHSAS